MKSNKIKNVLYRHKYGISFLLVILALSLFVVIENNGILLFSGDSYETMYQFYVGSYTNFHEGGLLSFDFSMGLGGNPLYNSFYFLFSPFFYLTCLLPKSLIDESFLFMTLIKLVLIFFCNKLWLKEISKSQLVIGLGSLIMTFSGWVIFYSHYVFFLDHFFVLPLLLYLSERFIKHGRWKWLTLATAYIAIANYYFTYLFLPFICIYTLYRCLVLEWKIKDVLYKGIQFIGVLFLGLAIAAIVFIPNIVLVLTNPRLSSVKDVSVMGKFEIFKIISGFLSPIASRLDGNLFIDDKWYRFVGWGNGASLYSSALIVLSSMYFIFTKNTREKILTIAFLGLSFLFYLLPVFSYLLQGTMDTRWFFYFIVIFILMFKQVMEDFKVNFSKLKIVAASFSSCILVGVCVFVAYYFKLNDLKSLNELLKIEIIVIAFIVVYGIMIYFKKTEFILGVLTLEFLFIGTVFFSNNELLDYTTFISEYTENIVKDIDDSEQFYRVNQDGYDYWPSNNTFAKNINGLTFYNSIYNYEMEDYLNRFKSTWSMPSRGGEDIAYSLLGIKYWQTKVYNQEPPYGYKLINSINGIDIYQNAYFIELGHGYDKTINVDSIKDLTYLEQDLIMQEYLITEHSLNNEYNIDNPLILKGTYQANDEINITDSIWGTVLLFENKNKNDVVVEFYYNGSLIKSYPFYDQSYFTIPLHENYYIGEIKIINKSERDMNFNYYHIKNGYFENLYDKRIESSFRNTLESSNYIYSEITLGEPLSMFTSIPYDDGWSVYANGEQKEYYKANMGFIGFDLTAGEYIVEFKYEIPYIKIGFATSCLSGLVFILIFYWERKYDRKV